MEVLASLILLLGWVFIPFHTHSGVFTMPELPEQRRCSAGAWLDELHRPFRLYTARQGRLSLSEVCFQRTDAANAVLFRVR